MSCLTAFLGILLRFPSLLYLVTGNPCILFQPLLTKYKDSSTVINPLLRPSRTTLLNRLPFLASIDKWYLSSAIWVDFLCSAQLFSQMNLKSTLSISHLKVAGLFVIVLIYLASSFSKKFEPSPHLNKSGSTEANLPNSFIFPYSSLI